MEQGWIMGLLGGLLIGLGAMFAVPIGAGGGVQPADHHVYHQ